jgi:hypothetical protein
LIKDRFVALAVGQVYQGGDDADGDFIRRAARGDQADALPSFSGTHGYACMTASGQFLGRDPVQGLAAWEALPEDQRKPGAIELGERGPRDESIQPPAPPPGGLILRLFYRNLARTPDGKLRLAAQEDFPFGQGRVNLDAQPNYLWLTKDEWKSLIPERPVVGQSLPVPAEIADRICLQYLHPVLTFCACSGWSTESRRGQELNLVVEVATDATLRLRLEGFAKLGAAGDASLVDDLKGPFGFEPKLLGHLEYDPKAQRITRFEFVALGDVYGYPNTDDAAWRPSWRAGRQPLGITFEMVSGDTPSERIPAKVAP